jgi:hypothetical protein
MKIMTVWPGGFVEILDPPEEMPLVMCKKGLAVMPVPRTDSCAPGPGPWLEEYIQKIKEKQL